MAIVFLNPDGASSIAGWNTGYSTTASHLSQGDTSNEWRTNAAQTGKVIFTLDDFNNTGVDSITNIKHQLICYADARSGTFDAIVAIRNAAGQTLYTETHANTVGAGFQTFTGTARTTSDGSSAWTDSDLDGLKLFLTCVGGPHNHIVQQLYITVTYVESGYPHKVNGTPGADISSIKAVPGANIGTIIGVG